MSPPELSWELYIPRFMGGRRHWGRPGGGGLFVGNFASICHEARQEIVCVALVIQAGLMSVRLRWDKGRSVRIPHPAVHCHPFSTVHCHPLSTMLPIQESYCRLASVRLFSSTLPHPFPNLFVLAIRLSSLLFSLLCSLPVSVLITVFSLSGLSFFSPRPYFTPPRLPFFFYSVHRPTLPLSMPSGYLFG